MLTGAFGLRIPSPSVISFSPVSFPLTQRSAEFPEVETVVFPIYHLHFHDPRRAHNIIFPLILLLLLYITLAFSPQTCMEKNICSVSVCCTHTLPRNVILFIYVA